VKTQSLTPVLVGILLVTACASEEIPDVEPTTSIPEAQRVENALIPMTEEAQPQLDRTAKLSDRMLHYGVPGVGIAVIEDFAIVWAKGYGSVRADGNVPVTAKTLFHAGSVAKTLSATATLNLVQQGTIGLDEDINHRLTSWKVPENEFTAEEKVTLRRLLSHSGGLQDGFTERSSSDAVPSYFTPAGEKPPITLEQLLSPGPDVDVDGPTIVTAVPGSKYRYANADYVIVELMIRDVTDKPFADFMHETVLRPLGMSSSTYEQPLPVEHRELAAVEHDISGRPIAGDRFHIPMAAAGGLWTTPEDLARFAVEIMQAYHGRSDTIVSRTTVQEMLSKYVAIDGNPLADAAGLGFHLSGEGDEFAIFHTGGTWGSTAILWAYPETGKGAVVMTNSATGSLLRFEILMAVAREYGWPIGSSTGVPASS
jgi:CubicO group peptidase (beta-lactamase class C family)